MRQAQDVLIVHTDRPGHHSLTAELDAWIGQQGMETGVVHLLVQHVLAALTIRQIRDRDDLQSFFDDLEGVPPPPVPRAPALYATQLSIPVRDGRMALGDRQAVFLYEEREDSQTRRIVVHLIGE